MGVRKNVRDLTSTEKQNFIQAIKALKANGTWDQYVLWHSNAQRLPTPSNVQATYRNAAHRGPSFLPWHRYYLYRLELALQNQVSGVTVPYWNWVQDAAAPLNSPIWANDFMGGSGDPNDSYLVKTGPFAVGQWTIIDVNGRPNGGLKRQLGVRTRSLPNQSQVDVALGETPYDNSPWDTTDSPSHRNRLEGWLGGSQLHNLVHTWAGGDMYILTAPNDPLFYLHHCNLDRIWSLWQSRNSSQGYAPTSGGPSGHNLNDPMYPWNGQATSFTATPAQTLDINALGYSYA